MLCFRLLRLAVAPVLLLAPSVLWAQIPEKVYAPNIHTVQLYGYGNQLSYPVMRLNSNDRLELHFDDLDGGVRNYSYTFLLCDANWNEAMVSQIDYLRGYSQIRITTYRTSSIALTTYTHYQAILPDRNAVPTRSGNYILKVFRDGDTSKLLFTRRMLIIDQKSSTAAQVQQPYNGQIFNTHQKIQFKVAVNESLNVVNPLQQMNVVILQNFRWDNAVSHIRPSFYSRNTFEYNTENDAVFPAGKEWRWLDLRSFRLQSDRVERATYGNRSTDIFVKPDADRSRLQINFYRDADGQFVIETTENFNPFWEADYATVHFRFVPPGGSPFRNQDLYIVGAFTGYEQNDNTRMKFNTETGEYETSLLMKQGYYDYGYATVDRNVPGAKPSFAETEGNYWETENTYVILVYYRPLGGRNDELIGYTLLNSRSQ